MRGTYHVTKSAATGLSILGARVYDPTIGKFLSVDSVLAPTNPQQNNGYSYALNSPITQADPTGNEPANLACTTVQCENASYGGPPTSSPCGAEATWGYYACGGNPPPAAGNDGSGNTNPSTSSGLGSQGWDNSDSSSNDGGGGVDSGSHDTAATEVAHGKSSFYNSPGVTPYYSARAKEVTDASNLVIGGILVAVPGLVCVAATDGVCLAIGAGAVDAEEAGASSEYLDITRVGSKLANRGTDVSAEEFASNLKAEGWTSKLVDEGKGVYTFSKDGAKYSLRGFSNSTDGPTAEYFPRGSKSAVLKLRLDGQYDR